MTSTSPGARIVGTLRRLDDDRGAVRMEDVYDTGIDDLWSAVTDPERLARWLVEVDGDLRVGGQIQAKFTSSWTGLGRIDICDAPHRLLVTLSPGTADETVIEATLTAEADQTRLVVEERGIPLGDLAGHGSGWQAHVEDLTSYLAGGQSEWHSRWIALTPDYEAIAADLT